MKQRVFYHCLGICSGLAISSVSSAAGLSISNVPLYVTQPLAPNVIISPVYNVEFNEASLRNPPAYSVLAGKCNENDLQMPCTQRDGYLGWLHWWFGAPYYNAGGVYGWRVVPWPGERKGTVTVPEHTEALISDISLYPTDRVPGAGSGGGTQFKPLDFVPSRLRNKFSSGQSMEMFPESDGLYEPVRGRTRYLRSDLNFLYFNKAVAASEGQSYLPWPSLGNYTFTAYGSEKEAERPYYHPLVARTSVADLKDKKYPSMVRYCAEASCGTHKTYETSGAIGQYWTYNGEGDVWNASSYARTDWKDMSDAEKVKFAHWFTYWRSSDLAARGMMGRVVDALSSRNMDVLKKIRLGIFHSIKAADGSLARKVGVEVRDNESDLLTALADIVYNQNSVFTMPLTNKSYVERYLTSTIWDPSATVAYFSSEIPYRENPRVEASETNVVRSCRRNYEIVLTPDYLGLRRDVNGAAPRAPTVYAGNADAALGAPYSDNYANTFGDVGAHGWNTDLMPNLDNNLLPNKINTNRAQHLVRLVLGPSETGLVFNKKFTSYEAALKHLADNPANTWYDPADFSPINSVTTTKADEVNKTVIDELWHMALNSRGFFYSGDNVSEAMGSLLQSFNDILVSNVSGSSIATSTTHLTAGGVIYLATVDNDWKGHLRAYRVKSEAAANDKQRLSVDFNTPIWDVAESVSAQHWNARNIATYVGTGGVPFRWGEVGEPVRNALKTSKPSDVTDANIYGQKVLEYLRGSGQCEDGSGQTCASGVAFSFRRRNLERNNYNAYSLSNTGGRNVLGDIANSNPWLISAPVPGRSDVDYPGYNAFRVARKDREKTLYVGANDGMVHAIRASDGSGLFGYIPSFVNANLHALTGLDYTSNHKYYVDGSPFSADVDVDGWKTLLAGGANRGGKGYYLLDVTNPTENTEATASQWVKWEFTHDDLHYSFNMPVADGMGQARQFVRTNYGGKPALIVGNGYPEDAARRACLFIIYLAGPTGANKTWVPDVDYRKLCVGQSDYRNDGGLDTNGLSTPTPLDSNGDGKVDMIYAGDLNGNMWRFDVNDDSPGTWSPAYSGTPLFVARNGDGVRQPIISPAEVSTYVEGSKSGQLLLFGTGKYIETVDISNAQVQSFYGVWDRGLSGITRSNLVEQRLDDPVDVGGVSVRKQSNKSVPAYCSEGESLAACVSNNKHLGWRWDMPVTGERLTGKVSWINSMVLFNTFYPSYESYVDNGVTKYRLDPCKYGGDGWLMALNAVNGYMEDQFSVFDVNRDGLVDSSDPLAAGVKVGASMGGTNFARGLEETMVGFYSSTNVSLTDTRPAIVQTDTPNSGRVSWFELID